MSEQGKKTVIFRERKRREEGDPASSPNMANHAGGCNYWRGKAQVTTHPAQQVVSSSAPARGLHRIGLLGPVSACRSNARHGHWLSVVGVQVALSRPHRQGSPPAGFRRRRLPNPAPWFKRRASGGF